MPRLHKELCHCTEVTHHAGVVTGTGVEAVKDAHVDVAPAHGHNDGALGPFGSQVEGHIYKSMTKSGTASREELAALVREHKSRTHERVCV